MGLNINRRKFLQTSLALTASLSIPIVAFGKSRDKKDELIWLPFSYLRTSNASPYVKSTLTEREYLISDIQKSVEKKNILVYPNGENLDMALAVGVVVSVGVTPSHTPRMMAKVKPFDKRHFEFARGLSMCGVGTLKGNVVHDFDLTCFWISPAGDEDAI